MIVSENYHFYKNNQRSLTKTTDELTFLKKNTHATLWNVVLYEGTKWGVR